MRLFRRRTAPLLLMLAALTLPAAYDMPPVSIADAQSRTSAQVLADARRLAFNGEWEAAADTYRPLLSDAGLGTTARFELARVYEQLDRYQDANDALSDLLGRPASELVVRGWYLEGTVRTERGDQAAALAAYARYIELGGPAAAYARLAQGRILSTDNRDAALAVLEPLVGGSGPALARRQALALAGHLEETAERWDRALARYTDLLNLTTWNSERALALEGIGNAQARLGNVDAAAEAYRGLAARYPSSAAAERALTSLETIGRPADPLTAGIVHYRRGNNQQARDLFNAYLRDYGSTGPGAATALFYLGALAERRDDTQLALDDYDEAFQADPSGTLAPEALWERAHVLEDAQRPDEARAAYSLLADRFPGSRHAPDAAFRAGYIRYAAGQKDEARAAWSAGVSLPNAEDAARAAFWAGRAAAELGDSAGARQAYAEAVQRSPAAYYGLRAAAVLAGDAGAPGATVVRRGTIGLVAPDWAQAEGWLAGWAGPEDPRPWQAVSASEDWRAGLELLLLNQHTTGTDAVELVIEGHDGQPWVLYRMARALDEAGQPHLAYEAAALLLAAAPAAARTAPAAAAIARVAYPAPWPDVARYFSEQYGLDPLLLYALIRQESAFDPAAGSPAGAFGLTQVIASTAGEIARALGKDGFAFGDLARPIVAIQFGTYYEAAQLRAFDGNVYQALAAYNGGAGNAARWARAGGPTDVDRFFEEIDFSETALYLRTVIQNYAWYRYLYGVSDRPSLTGGEAVTVGNGADQTADGRR